MTDFNIVGWILNPNIWFILGVLILGAGVAFDLVDVTLIIGVPAIIIALFIAVFPHVLTTWVAAIVAYIVTTAVTFGLFMKFEKSILGNEDYDVNDE